MAGDGGDGYAVVVRGGVAMPGPFRHFEDPGFVDVQDHAAAPGC